MSYTFHSVYSFKQLPHMECMTHYVASELFFHRTSLRLRTTERLAREKHHVKADPRSPCITRPAQVRFLTHEKVNGATQEQKRSYLLKKAAWGRDSPKKSG